MAKRRVVITGLGAITPLGNDVPTTWDSCLKGVSGIGPITRFDATAFPTRIAAEVKGFDPKDYLDLKEIKKHDAFSQFALAAAIQAWRDAKLEGNSLDQNRMGCILGVGIGGLTSLEYYHQAYLEGGPKKISPFLIPRMISNLAPGHIGIHLGLKGVNFVVTSACTSATHAIGEAYRMVSNGIQDLVMTGGAESAVCPIGIGGFCAMKALSTRNDEPQKASRPFDRDRDGFVLGEGAAVIVVESLDSALARGAKIYAELIGYGVSCDAYHMTAPSEGGEGAIACMDNALKDAGISPSDVQYINAHGTSTGANDPTETKAIRAVFKEAADSGLMVSSTKSVTGHLLGAAGAIEAVFCSLAIDSGKVPPTMNLDNPGDGCDLDYVANSYREAKVKVALSNSFGFGGTNATVIFAAPK